MTYREKIDQERAIKKAEEEIKAFEYSPSVHVIGSIYVDEYGKCTVPTWAYKKMINDRLGFDFLPFSVLDHYTGVMLRI